MLKALWELCIFDLYMCLWTGSILFFANGMPETKDEWRVWSQSIAASSQD